MPTISLTLTAAQAQRLAAAYKAHQRLDHDPTLAEVREYLVRHLKGIVAQIERQIEVEKVTIQDLGEIT